MIHITTQWPLLLICRFVTKTELKNYHNSQPSSRNHTLSAPCGPTQKNQFSNDLIAPELQGSGIQYVLPSSVGTAWPSWKFPIDQRKRLVHPKNKHCLVYYCWFLFVTPTRRIWDVYTKRNWKKSWCKS